MTKGISLKAHSSLPSYISEFDLRRLEEVGLALVYEVEDDRRLVLRDLESDQGRRQRMLPLTVDFLSGPILHRFKNGLSKNQPLSRALGLQSARAGQMPYVFDATAGLGVDAFFIAALGCRVRAVERSPIVFALLEDGVRRLIEASAIPGQDQPQAEAMFGPEVKSEVKPESKPESKPKLSPEIGQMIREILLSLRFELGEAAEVLNRMGFDGQPDVVYLDPMYPEEGRSKSALPKKGMQLFRRLIGPDQDTEGVFEAALKVARQRVVVKRPLYAPPISNRRPTHVFEGKTARFDMYLSSKAT